MSTPSPNHYLTGYKLAWEKTNLSYESAKHSTVANPIQRGLHNTVTKHNTAQLQITYKSHTVTTNKENEHGLNEENKPIHFFQSKNLTSQNTGNYRIIHKQETS